MTAIGRGFVKTKNGTLSQNFDLPECAAFDYFWLGNGRKTPEIEMALSFYTASAKTGHWRAFQSPLGLLRELERNYVANRNWSAGAMQVNHRGVAAEAGFCRSAPCALRVSFASKSIHAVLAPRAYGT